MSWLSTEFYYYPASAPCRAVHMAIKALGVECDEKEVDLLKAENKRPWFVRLNPKQEVPVYNDCSFVMVESRAIMMYLCNKHCKEDNQYLYPKDPEARGKVDKYMFFDMGTLSLAMKEYFAPKLFQGMPPDPEKENHLKQSLDYLDGFLEEGGTPFVAGDKYTIADISLLATLTELDAMEYNYKFYGEVTRFANKMKSEFPFYEEVCAKGVEMTKAHVKQLEADFQKAMEKERKQSLKHK